MHNLDSNFIKILSICKQSLNHALLSDGNTELYPNKPKMADIEVIALAIMAEQMSISSENCLFEKLRSTYSRKFPNLISRPRFNIRRRRLQHFINEVCVSLASKLGNEGEAMIIDSMPVPICENPRKHRSSSCKDDPQVQPSLGYHASHKRFYYGFKLQLVNW